MKYNPDKEISYRIVLDFWQDDTEDRIQLSTQGVNAFLVKEKIVRGKVVESETQIDNNRLPWLVYSEMKEELELAFPRQEKKLKEKK